MLNVKTKKEIRLNFQLQKCQNALRICKWGSTCFDQNNQQLWHWTRTLIDLDKGLWNMRSWIKWNKSKLTLEVVSRSQGLKVLRSNDLQISKSQSIKLKVTSYQYLTYLIFVANATNGVSVKILKWEEFFPYLTRKEPLWNLVISHIMCDFTHNEYFFHPVFNFTHNV